MGGQLGGAQRKSSEQILDLVRHEVASELSKIDSKSLESLANQVADVLKKSAEAGRRTTRDVTNQAGKQATKVSQQATKTAQGVRDQAGKTATRARAAAETVRPAARPEAGDEAVDQSTGTAHRSQKKAAS